MSKFPNTNPTAPWNVDPDNKLAPWNNLIYGYDFDAPWCDPLCADPVAALEEWKIKRDWQD